MTTLPLTLAIDRGVARITIDRPASGNALTAEVAALLAEAVDAIAADPSARVVVMTGTGDMFSAGGDIREFVSVAAHLAEHIDRGLGLFNHTLAKLVALPLPVIAALNGPVAGGGIGLALSADVVIAAESARFRAGYAAIGLSPDAGTSYHLTRLMGPQRAKEFLFTNRFIDAREALASGLVAKVVPDADLPAAVDALVNDILRFSKGSHAAVKTLVNAMSGLTHEHALELERTHIVANAASDECRAGIHAFVERRAAV